MTHPLRDLILSSRVERRSDRKRVLQEIAELVGHARHRVETWRLRDDSFSVLRLGVQEVYRKGRKGYQVVSVHPSSEGLHEWRKQVKHSLTDFRVTGMLGDGSA